MTSSSAFKTLAASKNLVVLPVDEWQTKITPAHQAKANQALEQGKVLFFPKLKIEFTPEELEFLTTIEVLPGTKNISYASGAKKIQGAVQTSVQTYPLQEEKIRQLMQRFAESAKALVLNHFPHYANSLQIGRTSLRPVEIAGRQAPSYRKDDTRLHVDAFPASPNQGRRILRVFYNYNFAGKPRTWRVGEPFPEVVARFFAKIKTPFPGSALALKTLKLTKGKRSLYDHYMLQLHNTMKYDLDYQSKLKTAEIIDFPANTAWMVYTDQVSHAALAGQQVLEQTFYLPVAAMVYPAASPLKVLERHAGKNLV